MWREIETGDKQAGVICLDLAQKSAGSASHIEQSRRATPAERAPVERPPQGNQRLSPHRCSAAAKQHFYLVVVPLRRSAAQIPVGLKMELLQVVGRIATRRHPFRDQALLAGAMPPLFDR